MHRTARIAALGVLLVACSTQSQLIVVVDTNLDIPGELDAVEIVLTGLDGVQTVTPQSVSSASDFPLTLGVTPETGELGPIGVAAVGRLGGVEVVRNSATDLTLVAGETRVLHLLLVRSCVGRGCGAGQTCTERGCVDAGVDVGGLAAWDGTPPPFPTGDACLAMPWDVDGDGHGDVACGGDDCDDANDVVYTGATEECDGVDNDCDAMADEDCGCAPIGASEPCRTSCGSSGTRMCGDTGWSTCAPGAETCNGQDDDCDGDTDESFVYEAGAPLNVTDDPAALGTYSNEPALAWMGDRWAVAFDDEIAGDGTHVLMLAPDGTPMGPPVFLGAGRTPSVAFDGSVLAVAFWSRETDATTMTMVDRIHLRMVGADGTPTTDLVVVEADADNTPRPSVVWDGTAFAVSYLDGPLRYHRFAPDGSEIGTRANVPASLPGMADLAFDGASYALAWARNDSIYFTAGSETAGFMADGAVVGTNAGANGASLVWTGSGYVVAWLASPFARATALDATGAPIGMPVSVSTNAAPRPGAIWPTPPPIGIAAAPGQVLVTWADQVGTERAVFAARVSPSGAILQPAARVSEIGSNDDWTDAAWSGDAFGIAWEGNPSGWARSEILFSRFACP